MEPAQPIKNTATVNDYARKERNKWNMSMAKNNAATILSEQIITTGEAKEKNKAMVRELYLAYREIDEEFKEELP